MPLYTTYLDADWPRLEADWTAWWNGALERPLLVLTTKAPVRSMDGPMEDEWETLTRFAPDTPVEAILDDGERWLRARHYYADAYPRWWPNFGPGIVGALLGSPIEYRPGTTWFYPVGVSSLAELTVAYDPENVWWKQVQAVTRGAVARWGSVLTVGYADLGGSMDVLASLRGTQDLLRDLYDAPDEVARLMPEITALWLRYYRALNAIIAPSGHGASAWGPCWFPTTGYFLQCDLSYMFSPKVFERYGLPDLAALCAAMDYPVYHLDGKAALKHLDLLLSLPRLRAVQWQPGEGQPRADAWPDILRRIRAAGKLCQVYVDRQGAFSIARELGGKGFVMEIVEDLTDQEATEFVQAFWTEIRPGEPVPGAARYLQV